ncbi:hypothetical protein CC86DRAFT_375201 [Ophiobolus disseminans]|uniref:Methyltransferase-domain-containing protein n=1 Tax=Ophiobolus disseminans TaxID=1469910 RepID=A0A6A6ZEC1_9PLEO|nr:hypothetical protein CC86DRAFT_375201 [Ophiobolus disseminans]
MVNPATVLQLRILQRQYFQLVEPHQLRWLDENTLKTPDVQTWLFTEMFDVEKIKSPPPDRYQLRVLKLLISKLERAIDDPEEDEISDNLMSAMSSLLVSSVPSEADSAQQKAFVTYAFPRQLTDDTIADDRTVTLLEARSVISSSGTTGLRTWEAALLLGSYLASTDGQASIRGKRVFELGAGTGMLSILCAKHLDIAGIVATDGDEAVVDTVKTNFFLNGLDTDDSSGCIVRTASLKWGRPVDTTTFTEDYGMEAPNFVLGADVTYDKFVIPRLVTTLRDFFELNPALEVLISATIRNEQTFQTFLDACERNSFSLGQVEFPPVPEYHQVGPFYPTATPIQIWRITRHQTSGDPFAF